MYIIIWEYQVRAEHVSEFEEIYSTYGAWTKLFQQSPGFLKTELLRDVNKPHRYMTIDRWNSRQDHEEFLEQWKIEYATLDEQCEGLTEKESLLGKWESVSHETR